MRPEFYSPDGAARVRDLLPAFPGGNVVIAVLGGFFKCPPAPYETAVMLHDYLARRGVRDATTIHLVTPMPKPIPISDETSDALTGLLDERGIRHSHASWIDRLDPATKVAHLKDGQELPFDLFLAVPVHRAPPVVVESGLTEDGWIPVDPATFATRFPDVYAVGDVTSAPVPRAGVIAEGEAATVADVLIARITGRPPRALPRRNDLLHRDGRGHRRHSRRELPVRAGTHRTFHPAVARRGRGQTLLRRLPPRSLVRSRIRRKPARWHDPRFSVTT